MGDPIYPLYSDHITLIAPAAIGRCIVTTYIAFATINVSPWLAGFP